MNNKPLVLALAFTESSLNYNVKHKGDVAKGICGIIPVYHKELLKDNNVKINSLKACEVVYEYYLQESKGNKVKALKEYKGISSKKNTYLIFKVIELEKKIKKEIQK